MISVVIPSFNRCECLRKLLGDVFAQRGPAFEVIVVDDCSADDSAAMVEREFPAATLLRNQRNGGPCVTRNRGIRAARGEIIVGFDSDVSVPDRQLLAKVSAAFKECPEASGFAFRIFGPDQVSDDAPRWWHPLPLAEASQRRFETDYFSGTAFAFRRDVVVHAGLFPEVFYMHYEEVELALRVLDGGGAIHYRPELAAVHHANPVSRRSEIKVFYKPRNQVLLALRCHPWGRALGWLTPRVVNGLFAAAANRSLHDWWRAMLSARALGGDCLAERNPVGAGTWKRIAGMRRQNLATATSQPRSARPYCRMAGGARPRVLIIAPYYDRAATGESWSTYQWVKGISEGCETTVLTTHPAGWKSHESPTGAAEVVNWTDPALPGARGRLAWELKPGYPLFYLRARRWLKAALRDGRSFDLVHQINPLALRYPSPARGLGMKLVIGPLAGSLATPDGMAEGGETTWFRRLRALDRLRLRHDPWLRGSYAGAAALVGVAPYVGELLRPCRPQRFEIMAETGVAAVAGEAKQPPPPGDPLRLLFVGRIIRTKGILDAIRAVALVADRANVRLDVLGVGDLLETCRQAVAVHNLGEIITFHGRLGRAEVSASYRRSHVFLFPSFREPSGNVVFEAMSEGLPVIACNYGGPGHVVDATCGRLVDPATPERFAAALADQILTLADQPELIRTLSVGALARMRAHALWPAKIQRMLDLYGDLLAATPDHQPVHRCETA
jgi:glycosyltransferase involved in cell wall biosynthesis/GT2 family glycosyltransferase